MRDYKNLMHTTHKPGQKFKKTLEIGKPSRGVAVGFFLGEGGVYKLLLLY